MEERPLSLREPGSESDEFLHELNEWLRRRVLLHIHPGDNVSITYREHLGYVCTAGIKDGQTQVTILFKDRQYDFRGLLLDISADEADGLTLVSHLIRDSHLMLLTELDGKFRIQLRRPDEQEGN